MQIKNNPHREAGVLEELPYEEAQERAHEAANRLEELMGQYSPVPYKRDESRVEYFVSECMFLLANRYVITSPEQ